WTPVLLSTLHTLGVTPDFLVEHQYQYGPGAENDAKLLSGLDAGGWTISHVANGQLRAMLKDYLPDGTRVQLLQTEIGTVWANPGKQSVNLPGGLAMAVMVGDSIKTEYRATDWWLWQDNYVNTDPKRFNLSPALYGWRLYGHYGVARFDAKLGKPERHPVFYIARMLGKFLRDGDTVYECTSSEPLLKIYCVRHMTGSLSVLVVNTAPDTNYSHVRITLTGCKARGTATVWTYGKANDDAARDQRPGQDLTRSTQAVFGSTITRSFPQYSATLMTFRSAPN
ncbi:MAG: alpha-L-arabinofuranosidase, partial [Armatimonadota bacterium]|nr:alpha-L-arabinofuranosidase [Armatimonadota bacterium]